MTLTAEVTTTQDQQRIYVACLAAYNSGILHGEWIDIEDNIDDTWAQINAMLKASPIAEAEEWAIHDFEGFESIRLSEWESIERVHEFAEFMQENGEVGGLALDHCNHDIQDAIRTLEGYMGCYSSVADYAQEIAESCMEIPDHLKVYIDYDRMGRDMVMSGDIVTFEEGYDRVHVFLNS